MLTIEQRIEILSAQGDISSKARVFLEGSGFGHKKSFNANKVLSSIITFLERNNSNIERFLCRERIFLELDEKDKSCDIIKKEFSRFILNKNNNNSFSIKQDKFISDYHYINSKLLLMLKYISECYDFIININHKGSYKLESQRFTTFIEHAKFIKESDLSIKRKEIYGIIKDNGINAIRCIDLKDWTEFMFVMRLIGNQEDITICKDYFKYHRQNKGSYDNERCVSIYQ